MHSPHREFHFSKQYKWHIVGDEKQVNDAFIVSGKELKPFLSAQHYTDSELETKRVHIELTPQAITQYNRLISLLRYLDNETRAQLVDKMEEVIKSDTPTVGIWDSLCQALTGCPFYSVLSQEEKSVIPVITQIDLEKHPFKLNPHRVISVISELNGFKTLLNRDFNKIKQRIIEPLTPAEEQKRQDKIVRDMICCEERIQSISVRHHLSRKHGKTELRSTEKTLLKNMLKEFRLLSEKDRIALFSQIKAAYYFDTPARMETLNQNIFHMLKEKLHLSQQAASSETKLLYQSIQLATSTLIILSPEKFKEVEMKVCAKDSLSDVVRRYIYFQNQNNMSFGDIIGKRVNHLYNHAQLACVLSFPQACADKKAKPLVKVISAPTQGVPYIQFRLNNSYERES